MKTVRGYKTELDPNNTRLTELFQHAGAARWAFNWGLRRKISTYEETGKSPSAIDLHRELNLLKKTPVEDGGVPWMYGVSKCAPQEALRNLDTAYFNFFRRCKQGAVRKGFPRFKSKKRGVGSFTLTGAICVGEADIRLPRLGTIRLKEHGYLPVAGVKILRATISESAGRWFVSLQVEQETTVEKAPDRVIGVDVGLKSLAVTSDGEVFSNPRALQKAERKLRTLQKAVNRKVKGSNNRRKAVLRLAKQHQRVADVRKDAIHKATTAIAKQASVVVIEDLNVAGMMKNHCLARAIGDAGLSEFHRQLDYKVKWRDGEIVRADRFYSSSKTCSRCGAVHHELTLADRVFRCPACGFEIDRDLNAAINLREWPQVSAATACRPGSSGRSPRSTKLLVGQVPNTVESVRDMRVSFG